MGICLGRDSTGEITHDLSNNLSLLLAGDIILPTRLTFLTQLIKYKTTSEFFLVILRVFLSFCFFIFLSFMLFFSFFPCLFRIYTLMYLRVVRPQSSSEFLLTDLPCWANQNID